MSETLRDLVVSLSLNSDNFSRNIKSINKQIQEAESAFRLSSAGVENFETTTAGLSSKLSTLQRTFQLQQDAVGQYERALQQASDKLQECYTRQNDYLQRLADAKDKQQQLKTEVASAAQAYKHYKNTLGETDSATIAAKANLDAYKGEYRAAVQEVKKLEGQNIALKKSTRIRQTHTCAFQLTMPASVVPSISNVAFSEATSGVADRFGGYVRTRSKLAVSITATGAQGSSISAYRTSIDSVTYSGASFTSNTLNTAGNLTMTVTVTDSRGRTASATRTVIVLDYSPPSLSLFTAERCNADDTAAQTDGTKVRISAKASSSSVSCKNTLACTVYYKLSSAESWVSAVTLTPSDYFITTTNRLLSPTFDALSSYDIKIRVQDVFYYIEQTVSIGTKQAMMDFYKDGTGIAFGKVAENAGKVEFGWPLLLSEPLGVDQGGTGAETAACTKLGAVKKTGDTMTGNLAISGYLYPSLYLLPSYNSTTNRTVFEGSEDTQKYCAVRCFLNKIAFVLAGRLCNGIVQ